MEVNMKGWLAGSHDIYIMDMRQVVEIKPSMYRYILVFNQQLKSYKKHLYFLNLDAKLVARLRADGLMDAIVTVKSVDEAKKRGAATRNPLDVEFIAPFIAATKDTLTKMAKIAWPQGA